MKMLCRDVYNHAKADLGYDTVGGVSEIDDIDKRAVNTVNHVYRELYFKKNSEGFNPLNSLSDEVVLPEKVIFNCLIPGVAAKIAFDYGDGKLQAYFADIYNQGLRAFNSTTGVITDALPSDYMN